MMDQSSINHSLASDMGSNFCVLCRKLDLARARVNIVKEEGKICLIELVSDKRSDYYTFRLPDAYVNSFDNCDPVILRPIRRSKSTMQRLAKVMPRANSDRSSAPRLYPAVESWAF